MYGPNTHIKTDMHEYPPAPTLVYVCIMNTLLAVVCWKKVDYMDH